MNEILKKTQAALMEQADPRLKKPIEQTVEVGRKVLYSEGTQAMVAEELKRATDPEAIGAGVAKLLAVLYNQAKKDLKQNGLPMQVAIPAAMLLLCEVLDLLEEAGRVQVDAAFLAECTSAAGSAILQMFKATPDVIQQFVDESGAGKPSGIVGGATAMGG